MIYSIFGVSNFRLSLKFILSVTKTYGTPSSNLSQGKYLKILFDTNYFPS